MEITDLKEIIEIFLNRTIHEIKSESEVPNVNFKFNDEDMLLFKDVVDNPFISQEGWTQDATQKDIDLLMRQDEDVITIEVHDAKRFFRLLQALAVSLMKLKKAYEEPSEFRNAAMDVMRRIWLRMGIDDVNNIELFLERQLQFFNNMTFDNPKESFTKVDNFYDYNVLMSTNINKLYDESTRSMSFIIEGSGKAYELPRILYDIDDNGICYIFGVQNTRSISKDKDIERKLYKINKNIENPNVHPSKVYALLFFINELKKKGITKIVVPSMQVLNYRFHELLSEKAYKDLKEIKYVLNQFPNDRNIKEAYNFQKDWYDRVHEKQDKISYLKTEELFNLIYRISEHDPSIEITNDVNIQGDSININITR